MQITMQLTLAFLACAVQTVLAIGEIVVPHGTPNGFYQHDVHADGSNIVHYLAPNTNVWKTLTSHGILFNTSGTLPSVQLPNLARDVPVGGRFGKRAQAEWYHCDKNPIYHVDDVRGAIKDYERYVATLGSGFTGNNWVVRNAGVAYGCAFNGKRAYPTSSKVEIWQGKIDSNCGTNDRGYYDTEYGNFGWGRLQTDEGFCGGKGVPYGYGNS